VLAQRLNTITENREPRVLDTLAAAYAETGDFARAVRAAQHAVPQVPAQHLDLKKAIEDRLQTYQNGKSYRDPNFVGSARNL
jgi:hypothetical protein